MFKEGSSACACLWLVHSPISIWLGLVVARLVHSSSNSFAAAFAGHIAGDAVAIHAVHGGALSLGFLQKVSMVDEEGVWIRSRIVVL